MSCKAHCPLFRRFFFDSIEKMKAELLQIAASVSVGRRGADHATISKRIAREFGSKDAAGFFQWELKPLTPAEKTALLTQQITSGSKPIRGGSKVTHRFEWSFDEALMMGLTTCLLLQRTFRQNTPEEAPRVEQKTTTEKILRAFETYPILVYEHSPFLREVCTTRLTRRQRAILNRLNFPTLSQTLKPRLPPRPDG